jgi:hypothetical protein
MEIDHLHEKYPDYEDPELNAALAAVIEDRSSSGANRRKRAKR